MTVPRLRLVSAAPPPQGLPEPWGSLAEAARRAAGEGAALIAVLIPSPSAGLAVAAFPFSATGLAAVEDPAQVEALLGALALPAWLRAREAFVAGTASEGRPVGYRVARLHEPRTHVEVVAEYQGGVLVPVPHLVKHSPTGLEFGYPGSGPADLARSIVGHYLGDVDPAPALYHRFKERFLVGEIPDQFQISAAMIEAFLEAVAHGRGEGGNGSAS